MKNKKEFLYFYFYILFFLFSEINIRRRKQKIQQFLLSLKYFNAITLTKLSSIWIKYILIFFYSPIFIYFDLLHWIDLSWIIIVKFIHIPKNFSKKNLAEYFSFIFHQSLWIKRSRNSRVKTVVQLSIECVHYLET